MTIRILPIDGGSVRGVGPAHLLCELENLLRAAGKPGVSDSVDLFVGTSTGCILAAGLAVEGQVDADLTPTGLKQLYYDRSGQMFTADIFGNSPFDWSHAKYKSRAKARVLEDTLGGLKLGSVRRNLMGTFYNMGIGPGPVFAHGGPKYREKDNRDFDEMLVWQLVNASSSAPVYFDPVSVIGSPAYQAVGVDGGMFANNPAMCALIEAFDLWGKEADVLVASFGCGKQSVTYPTYSTWGVLEWASPAKGFPLLGIVSHGQSEVVSHQAKHLLREQFFRFEFSLDGVGECRMDDTTRTNIDRVVQAAEARLREDDCRERLKSLVAAL